MQGGNQQSPASPRKESSSSSQANFSLLGQQLKQFSASMQQQQNQNQNQNQAVHSSSLGFALGVNTQVILPS